MPLKKNAKRKTQSAKKISGSVVTRKVLKENKKPAITETQEKTETLKRGKLSLEVFNIRGKVVGSLDLPKEIFGAKVNNQLMSQAVRVYLANNRRGTASTKTRGEVHGSTRKIYRQKGTGRARHGSKKAPIFVHGGIVFGPKPRDFSLKLSKKMKRAALFSALTAKLKDHEIKIVKGLEKIEPKTRLMVGVLKNLESDSKKGQLLLVVSDSSKILENVYRGARNLEGVRIISAKELNTYDVLNNKGMLLMDKSLGVISETFLKN